MQQGAPAERAGLSDADRELLRDSLRVFLQRRSPPERALAAGASEIALLWRELAAQGIASLGADHGGLAEILLAFEELGRAACPAPLLGAVSAHLTLGSTPACGEAASFLGGIKDASALAAVAYGAFDGDRAAGRVERNSAGRFEGSVSFVEGAAGATHLLVFTDAPCGAAIVSAAAPGVTVRETPGLAVPSLSQISLRDAPGVWLPLDLPAVQDAALAARLCCAARALGAAQRAFELAVDHAKMRRQFGQFIGQFQAIQHKLADALVALDGSRLAIAEAAELYDRGLADWRVLAQAAFAFAGPALRAVSIQTHRALGAIGYAEEHEAPRHFRRVHADLARFGGAPRARAELADFLLGPL